MANIDDDPWLKEMASRFYHGHWPRNNPSLVQIYEGLGKLLESIRTDEAHASSLGIHKIAREALRASKANFCPCSECRQLRRATKTRAHELLDMFQFHL